MKASLELETATTEQEVSSHVAAWKQLEQRALDDNVYLSAAFLTTALKYFGQPYRLVFVYEKTDEGRELIAVAPFTWLIGFCDVWEDRRVAWAVPWIVLLTYLYTWLIIPRGGIDPQVVPALLEWIQTP